MTRLAGEFDESRQAIRKHLRVLTDAELIRLQRTGREQQCVLQPDGLAEIQRWVSLFENHWDSKLGRLKAFVERSNVSHGKKGTKMAKKRTVKKSKVAAKVVGKKKTTKVSPVKGKTVAWYVGTLEDWQAEIANQLDTLIRAAAPKASASIKWAQPVYELEGPFCFIKAAKNHVTVGFWRGVELDDEQGILEGAGSKMRHVKLTSVDDIQKTVFKRMVKQAVKLNKELGDPTR